jgi:hypothetical protein
MQMTMRDYFDPFLIHTLGVHFNKFIKIAFQIDIHQIWELLSLQDVDIFISQIKHILNSFISWYE